MFDNLVISNEPLVPNGCNLPSEAAKGNEGDASSGQPQQRRNRAKSKGRRRDKSSQHCLDRDKSSSGSTLDRDASSDRLSSTSSNRGDSSRRGPRAESKRRERFSGYRTPRSRSQEDLLDGTDDGRGGGGGGGGGVGGAYNSGYHDNWQRSGSMGFQKEWREGYDRCHENAYGNEGVKIFVHNGIK